MDMFIFLFFCTLVVAALFSMVKIHRQELLDAREAKRKHEARLAEFRSKCFRPHGD